MQQNTATNAIFHPTPIGMFAKTYAGSTPPRSVPGMFGGPHPWISSSELNQVEIKSTKESITDLAIASSAVKWIEPHSPVMAMYGATAGVVSWLALRATSNQAVLAFQVDPTKISARWLYWSLKCYASMIVGQCQGSGQPNISKEIVDRFQIPRPSDIDEQRRIAAILDASEAVLQTSEAVIEKLVAEQQGLRMSLTSPKPEWESITVEQLVAGFIDYRGRTPKKLGMDWGGGTIPALSANNVGMGTIDFSKECYLGSEALYQRWMTNGNPECGDVVMTMEAPLGNIAQVPDHRKYILSQRVILVKLDKNRYNPTFVRHLFMAPRFQHDLLIRSSGTTAVGIQRAELIKVQVSLPKKQEQDRIAAALDAHESAILSEKMKERKIRLQHQGLLRDLLTGKVRAHV